MWRWMWRIGANMMNRIKNLAGLFLLISFCLGALFQFLYPHLPWVTLSAWSGAAFFFVLWGVLHREKVIAFFTRRSVHYGANVGLIILLVFGILVALNVLGKQYSWKKDITRSGVNTLSAQTIKILNDLNKSVELVYFPDPKDKDKVDKILRLYRYQSKKFSYRLVDPNKDPALTRSLNIKRNNSGVLSAEGSEKKITIEEYTEEKFTNALVKLLKTSEQVVYFTTGHEERSIDDVAETPESITAIKKELEAQGYVVKSLPLVSESAVPKDAAAVAVIGPKGQFFPREIELLKNWAKAGGRLLLALEVDVARSGLSSGSMQLADLLMDYGVASDPNIVVDPRSREPQVALGLVGDQSHSVVKDFPTSSLGLVANFLFPVTAHFSLSKNAKSLKLSSLAKTSPDAWAERDWASIKSGQVDYDPKKDYRGQMDLAVAVESEAEPKTRIVAFASSSFANNGLIRLAKNRDLVLNAINWLTDQESFISIRPKADGDSESIDLSKSWLSIVFMIVVLLVPSIILGSGIWVWLRRRGR